MHRLILAHSWLVLPSPALVLHACTCTCVQVVDSLLDEVVNAGVERSVDPSLLEPSVLDRILSAMDAQ